MKGGVYVGRPSVLGNPFSHLEGTKALYRCKDRAEAVSRYEEWIREQINVDPDITKALKRLYKQWTDTGRLTLVCWCSPQVCHADILKKLLEEKRSRENADLD